MSSLATLFEPPDDATAEELRARLRALADLIARAPEGGAGRFPEVAFVENDQIGVEPWETYRK